MCDLMPACKSVSMYSKIRYMSLSFSALRTFNNLPSVQSIERSLEWVPLSVCGNNKWHLMIFSWLLTSCKNIISRKVRCFQKLQQQGELSPWMQQRQQSIPLSVRGILKCIEYLFQSNCITCLLVNRFPHDAIRL